MKVLYLSCHEVLEFDEVSLLSDLGIEVFSAGAYLVPDQPVGGNLRPPIPHMTTEPDDVRAFHELAQPGQDSRSCLTAEFLERFDAVIIMHMPEWVESCCEAHASVPIIWRTIGQSSAEVEQRIRPLRENNGLRIVRYSPVERRLAGYCGEDAVIRFGKSSSDFEAWTGQTRRVVTFAQHMRSRALHCRYDVFREVVEPFDCDLYGPGNEDTPRVGRGAVSYAEQRRILRDYRVYLYTGTHPASYTLAFMEAWLAGTPIVAIGRSLWEI